MAKKLKITKNQVHFLKTDLELDEQIVNRLSVVQNRFKTRFKTRIEDAKSEAVLRYNSKIEALKKAKTAAQAQYNVDIKKFEDLVKNIESTPVIQAVPDGPVVAKTPTRKTQARKAAAKKRQTKKPVAQKPAVKKAPPKRTSAKKTITKKTPVKRTPSTKKK